MNKHKECYKLPFWNKSVLVGGVKLNYFWKERMYLNTKQNWTGTERSGCKISTHQDQSSPTEHSHIIPWICSEVCFYKEEGSTVAFEILRNTRHQSLCSNIVFVCFAQQPQAGRGLLIREVPRSHTTTHHIR